MAYQVKGSRVEWDPTAARLRELTEKIPNASVTEFGNVVVKARVDSRSTRSIYIVEDSANSRGQTITRAEYDRVAGLQDGYIARSHMPVDLASGITRVLNSDYFGEPKKGGLRMWNNIVYDRGGLARHAGCKSLG